MVFYVQYLFRFNCISTMNTINVLVLLLAVVLAAEAGKTSILLCVTINFELNNNFKPNIFISVNIFIYSVRRQSPASNFATQYVMFLEFGENIWVSRCSLLT